MDLAEEYSMIYDNHTGRKSYCGDDRFSRQFVNAICNQHKSMKQEVESSRTSSKDIVDSSVYTAQMEAVYLDMKKELMEMHESTDKLLNTLRSKK